VPPAALYAALTLVAGVAVAADNPFAPEANDQRRAAQSMEPAALRPPGLGTGRLVTLRIRFHADGDYRAGLFRWADRVRAQLSQLNQFLEPGFGVRLEPESFRRWHRAAGIGDVQSVLAELEAHDAGQGVDWVVGYVTPLQLVTSSIHALGAARPLGKHFVMRGMASPEEAAALGRNFDQLEVGEREGLYGRRKWHKETAIFLHELLHTLGVPHSGNPRRLMHPSYSNQMSDLSSEDAELAALALRARLAAQGGPKVDWSALRGFVERTSSPEWAADERQQLLAALARTGARIGAPPPTQSSRPGALTSKQQEQFERAVKLLNDRKEAQAWTEVSPLGKALPDSPEVQRLMCRLGHVKEAGEQGAAACRRARTLDPTSPEPLLDEAQSQIMAGQADKALVNVDAAAALTGKLGDGQAASWRSVARLYGQLGALSRADECLARAPEGDEVEALRAAVLRDRRSLGMPASGASRLPAEREPALADGVRRVRALLGADRLKEASAEAERGLRAFPGAPGMLVVACEVDMRARRRGAERRCTEALAAFEELPRAHYLLGHARLAAGKRDAAITSLQRARALEPEDSATWETLADVYRMAGKRDELAQLRTDYQKAFGQPLK